MTELSNEISYLSKECDSMSKEESRMGLWQRKAEKLAKELGGLSHDLSVYNEYNDRTRVGDTFEDVKEEIEEIKSENEILHTDLEKLYEEKKKKEESLKQIEYEIESIQSSWNQLRKQFSPEQKHKYID